MGFLKRNWLKWHLRTCVDGDPHAFGRLYRLPDPWNLDVPGEHIRFRETTRFITNAIGKHFGSVLEVGCGEGLQSKHLAHLADRIVGIDPSLLAIKRARSLKISNATFEVADVRAYRPWSPTSFNLVTACELIYYFHDLEEIYHSLGRLGEICLATYYEGAFDRLDRFFRMKPVACETLHGTSCQWRVVWWKTATTDFVD
jgi:SAM-dependent methyltransferase